MVPVTGSCGLRKIACCITWHKHSRTCGLHALPRALTLMTLLHEDVPTLVEEAQLWS